jgi:hypothetical protein
VETARQIKAVGIKDDNDRLEFTAMPLLDYKFIKKTPAYTKSQLAKLYGVDRRTLFNWIKPFLPELINAGYSNNCQKLSPRIVSFIFQKIGQPNE